MVASSSRVLPKVPSLATFPVSSKTQNVCRRSPRSNPIVILFLLLAAVLLIRHRVYRHPQWRPPLPSHLISFEREPEGPCFARNWPLWAFLPMSATLKSFYWRDASFRGLRGGIARL